MQTKEKLAEKLIKGKGFYLLILALFTICNIVAFHSRVRVDLTEEHKFTLSPISKRILAQIPQTVDISILLEGELPVEFRKLSIAINDILTEMNYYARGKLHYHGKDPFALADSLQSKFLDTCYRLGLRSTNVEKRLTNSSRRRQMVLPGAILQYANRRIGINFLSEHLVNSVQSLSDAEALLEYKLMYAIEKLINPNPPQIAYATGHGEPLNLNTVDMFNTLARSYIVDTINLKTAPLIPERFTTLLIIHPDKPFSEVEKIKIDQFVMRGGRLFLALNYQQARLEFLQKSRAFTAQIQPLNLEDLLFQYGARLEYNLLLDANADQLPVQVGWLGEKPQFELIPFPYFPLLEAKDKHPITQKLDLIRSNFPSSIELIKQDQVQATVLLSSSNLSRRQGLPSIISWDNIAQIPANKVAFFQEKFLPVSVLLEGKFNSYTQGRLSALNRQNFPDTFHFLNEMQGNKRGKIILCSDANLCLNEVSRQRGPFEMGTNPYTQYKFGNSAFFANCLDYLSNPNSLISSRNKISILRRLDPKRLETEKNFYAWLNLLVPILLSLSAYIVYQVLRYRKYKYLR